MRVATNLALDIARQRKRRGVRFQSAEVLASNESLSRVLCR
jgi:hypothetical protein